MQTIDLLCPECGGINPVPIDELAVGHEIKCLHCAAPLQLSHEQESLDEPKVWQLESLDQFQEEERRT